MEIKKVPHLMKRIILVGHGASGKDFARQEVQKMGLSYGVSFTTRPRRETEVEGEDYFYLSKEVFEAKIENGDWYEYVEFNGWFYGTTKEQFQVTDNLFVMTPHGLSLVKDEDRKESLVIFFNIDEETRRERLAGRKDGNDTIERRLEADAKDFSKYIDWDIKVEDPLFDVNEILNHDFLRGTYEFVAGIETKLPEKNII